MKDTNYPTELTHNPHNLWSYGVWPTFLGRDPKNRSNRYCCPLLPKSHGVYIGLSKFMLIIVLRTQHTAVKLFGFNSDHILRFINQVLAWSSRHFRLIKTPASTLLCVAVTRNGINCQATTESAYSSVTKYIH